MAQVVEGVTLCQVALDPTLDPMSMHRPPMLMLTLKPRQRTHTRLMPTLQQHTRTLLTAAEYLRATHTHQDSRDLITRLT
mmetsp:Transcript_6658/g.12170  ORF Transcript_6658/g.12170 Transcript_6658/m.12170 type:complete len:80 (+) Transcript_6658:941-1180(+)